MISEDIRGLICDCWAQDAGIRPSFSVIHLRLQGLLQVHNEREQKLTGVKGSDEIRIHSNREAQQRSEIRTLARGLHNVLLSYKPASWNKRQAQGLVRSTARATAKDAVLNEILSTDEGPKMVKA